MNMDNMDIYKQTVLVFKKQSMAIHFPSHTPSACLVGTLIIKLSILKKARRCYELQRLLIPLAQSQCYHIDLNILQHFLFYSSKFQYTLALFVKVYRETLVYILVSNFTMCYTFYKCE